MGVISADVVLRVAQRDDDGRGGMSVKVRGVLSSFRRQITSYQRLRELQRGACVQSTSESCYTSRRWRTSDAKIYAPWRAVEALPQVREQALGDDGLEHAADGRRDGLAAIEDRTLERRQAVDGVRVARELRGRVAFC